MARARFSASSKYCIARRRHTWPEPRAELSYEVYRLEAKAVLGQKATAKRMGVRVFARAPINITTEHQA